MFGCFKNHTYFVRQYNIESYIVYFLEVFRKLAIQIKGYDLIS